MDEIKRIALKMKSRHQYVRGDKGVLEPGYQKLKQWHPEKDSYEVARTAGLVGIDLSWFLFCLGKFSLTDVFVDNYIINKWKEIKQNIKINDNDSRFKKFFKKLQKSYPAASARLQLWMVYTLLTLLTIGGGKLKSGKESKSDFSEKKSFKTEVISDVAPFTENVDYETFRQTLHPLTPWLIADLIAKEGVKLDENGLHKPYKDSRGIWTIGYGSTVLKNGKKVTATTKHITDDEAFELARWHIEDYETYPMLYWYYVYDNDLLLKTNTEAIGIGSIFYNAANNLVENKHDKNNKERFTILRNLRDTKYGPNIPKSEIVKCFENYPITDTQSFGDEWLGHSDVDVLGNSLINLCAGGRGMYWRRWLEAGFLTNSIDPYILLECPINSVSEFFEYMGGTKQSLWEERSGQWMPKKGSYAAFNDWILNPTDKNGFVFRNIKKVKDFLPQNVLADLLHSNYNGGAALIYDGVINDKVFTFNKAIRKIKDMQSNVNVTNTNDREISL